MAEFCTVYLSSSFKDLETHRRAIYDALNQIQGIKVIAMEDYVARDERPLQACLNDVNACDIYVGLFAWRYGYVPPASENPDGLSITALEFEQAGKANKPRLVFVLKDGAAWPTNMLDSHVRENENGKLIHKFREQLLAERLASEITADPATVARVVSNAVSSHLLRTLSPAGARSGAQARRLQREVTHALYLAHTAADADLAGALAQRLAVGFERSALLSSDALFARDERAVQSREESVVTCHAAAALVTAASLPGMLADADTVGESLHLLRARGGSLALFLAGVRAEQLPAAWIADRRIELGDTSAWRPAEEALRDARDWLAARQPPPGYRSVGVPVCVVAMTAAELAALRTDPTLLARLSAAEAGQFHDLMQALAAAGPDWSARYGATRHRWRPFDPVGATVRRIAEQMAEDAAVRGQGRQRQRHMRLQWYPFDCLLTDNRRLRPAYREVARAGCVVLLDELSLFHPVLREAFQNSPYFNNDQVAIVTVSPFDPVRGALDALLEDAARKRLAGAFDRYAVEYDPQCELAVSDERRLKRWLHSSLPATLLRLQEPRPDRGALGALAAELGEFEPAPKRDYGWGGGMRT
ncbi:MAG: DUF4062 domain-containing protein [Burkholderiaceae bacterium]